MPVVSPNEFRTTDISTYVEFNPLAAGDTVPTGAITGFRAFYTPCRCKIMAVSVVTGSTAVGTVTFTAGFDTRLPNGTVTPATALATTLGSASATAVASSTVTCPIDDTAADNLPPTIPAGSWVGVNSSSSASNAGSICGVLITYRPV